MLQLTCDTSEKNHFHLKKKQIIFNFLLKEKYRIKKKKVTFIFNSHLFYLVLSSNTRTQDNPNQA